MLFRSAASTSLGPILASLLASLPVRFAYTREDPGAPAGQRASALQLIVRHAPLSSLRGALRRANETAKVPGRLFAVLRCVPSMGVTDGV